MKYQLFWRAVDRDGFLIMGEYATRDAAIEAIPSLKQELIDQGGTAEGTWDMDEVNDEGTIVATSYLGDGS